MTRNEHNKESLFAEKQEDYININCDELTRKLNDNLLL